MAGTLLIDSDPAARLAPVEGEIAARAEHHDRTATFPHHSLSLVRETGLLDLVIPADAGGRGGSLADAVAVVRRLGAADPALALVVSQHYLLHLTLLRSDAAPEVVRAVQRSSLDDGGLVNALRVEPALGTPARGGLPATVARRQPDGGWALHGHKIYATGIPALRWLAVYAATDEAEPRVGTFLVAADEPGWRVVETWDHLGMRATASHDVILEGAPVPAGFAIDLAPAGSPRFDAALGVWNALLIAAVYDGVAAAATGWLRRYLHERVPANLGAPLASLDRFQQAVGGIEARLRASDRQLRSAAADLAHATGPEAVDDAALVKLNVTTNAIAAVEAAVALVGNPGLSRANPLERHYRDVLCSRIHTPQDDAILLAAGRRSLAAAATASPDRHLSQSRYQEHAMTVVSDQTTAAAADRRHPTEFIGMIAPTEYSEIIAAPENPVDPDFAVRFARAHEEAGFDRVLIGWFSNAPDGFIVASWVLANTTRLKVLLAHRPGFASPTVAARQLATLDQFSQGRLAVHIITGGDDADQAPRRRLARRRRPLPPHRRVPRRRPPHLDRHRALRPRR